MRMLGYKGSAQLSPMLGDALNAGYCFLEVHCLGCDTRQTVDLKKVRRPRSTTLIHELERSMRCEGCTERSGRPTSVATWWLFARTRYLRNRQLRTGGRESGEHDDRI